MEALKYGLSGVVPESARAAWGARLIHAEVAEGGTGVVPDRVDVQAEEQGSRETLLTYLDEKGDAIRKAMTEYGRGVHGSVKVKAVVFSDDAVTVMASPNGSYGYLYVTAWLKEGA